ncbi:protein aurora borealis [Uranotaenia lowii]|uniref:protein aurora borealis n=1 Tax=Uranotaenia lowii TaxID=190385 RepID=UPI00247A4C54|nr:protein aurora borealis [Uranotaenia lowii]
MDQEAFLTPRKIFQNAFNAARKSTAGSGSPSVAAYTPTSQLSRSSTGRFQLLPVIQTPPSRLINGKVINPFEAHLTDRLHLPVICSPSLFQRPSTPQNGSVQQFEWTIDEVSYLGPANVEAHETQFMETPDPVLEAKAQAAISAYFKEHNIVPSPIDCQLRQQKIVLKSGGLSSSGGFGGRKSKRKRDGITQTVLSFPPNLPEEVEQLLKPYFSFHDNQQQTHEAIDESDVSIDHDARDASLRRKLFNCFDRCSSSSDCEGQNGDDSLDRIDLQALSPAPVSPEIDNSKSMPNFKRSRSFGSLEILSNPADISLSPVLNSTECQSQPRDSSPLAAPKSETESFGALSPISKSSTSPSPLKPVRLRNSTDLEGQQNHHHHHQDHDHDAIYRSTPEKPKGPLFALSSGCTINSSSHHMSVDLSDSNRAERSRGESTVEFNDTDFSCEETALLASSQSSSSMSQHPTTPLRRTNRSVSRRNRPKNLSHSFLLYSDEDRFEDEKGEPLVMNSIQRRSFEIVADAKRKDLVDLLGDEKENIEIFKSDSMELTKSTGPEPSGGSNFYRMDSGFNEEETRTSHYETVEYDETDVSMQSDGGCFEGRFETIGNTPSKPARDGFKSVSSIRH